MTTSTESLLALSVTTDAERAEAGRRAIAECPTAFEELRGEGDELLVEYASRDDLKVLAALDAIGELSAEELPQLGQLLAEQLVEDAIEAEAAKQLGRYRAERREIADSRDAYELNDPKHPDFLERLVA
jgi:hypothetical protein